MQASCHFPEKLIRKFIIFAPILAFNTAANAQVGLGAGALQRNLEQQVPQFNPLPQAEPPKPNEQPLPQPIDQNAVRVLLKGVRFEGAKLFTDDQLQALVADYVGKSLALSELQAIADSIANFYQKNGRLAQVTLPPQTLEDGIVTFKITEGRLGTVHVTPKSHDPRFDAERAAAYITAQNPRGDPVDTNAVDRALLLLQETPGLHIEGSLEPGEKEGEVAVSLTTEDTALLTGNAGINNYGSRGTGQYQGIAYIGLQNPSGIGDLASLNAIVSQGSNFFQLGYSLPLNNDGLKLGLTASTLHYTNIDSFRTNGNFGSANVGSANLSYALLRSQTANVNTFLSYDQKWYLNKYIGTDVVNSQYIIRDINFGISGNRYDSWIGGGVNSASITLTTGTLGFNQAQYDAGSTYGQYTPRSFNKLAFSATRNQQIVPDKTILNITLSGQLANQNLDPAEQFYLGGPYAVQGYPVGQGRGSQGVLGIFEVQQQFPERLIGLISFQAGRVQQYVNPYDGWQGLTGANNWYNLVSVGPGLKWSYEQLALSASVSWAIGANPLKSNTGQTVNVDNRTTSVYGWFQAVLSF